MENPIFIILITTGLVFMLAGFLMYKFPPKKINGLYGYRTPSSMKSQERWDFAQKYSAKSMIKLGGFLSLCSFFGLVFNPSENIGVLIAMGLLLSTTVFLIFSVEIHIKKRFQ